MVSVIIQKVDLMTFTSLLFILNKLYKQKMIIFIIYLLALIGMFYFIES